MSTHFEPNIEWDEAFYIRGDLLRPEFGRWDVCDPVAHAILDLVEAQTELANAIDDDVNYVIDGEAAIKAAVRKRHAAGVNLMRALNE